MSTTIEELVLQKEMAFLKRGAKRLEIESKLGPPLDYVAKRPWAVTYDNIEIRYRDGEVDTFEVELAEGHVDVEKYLATVECTYDELISAVEKEGLRAKLSDALSIEEDDARRVVLLSNGVVLNFYSEELVAVSVESPRSISYEVLQDTTPLF